MEKRPIRLLWGAAILVCLFTVGRLLNVAPSYGQLDQASGVWTALATDLSRGVFYRPLVGNLGYGGTRYFPLHFVLHAMLIKCGMEPIPAGYLLAFTSGVLLIVAVFVLLRRLGVKTALALPAATLTLATISGQIGVSTIRGDLLPAALTMCGLAICAKWFAGSNSTSLESVIKESGNGEPAAREATNNGMQNFSPSAGSDASWATIAISAIFFTLAFSAKSTAVFGPAAVFGALYLRDRKRTAFRFAIAVGAGMVAFVLVTQWASGGRFLPIMKACASADADAGTLFTAPAAMLKLSLKSDPTSIAFLLLAIVALLYTPGRYWRELPAMFLVATAIVTLLIFGTPGVFLNHMVDLQAAAVVFIAVQIARERIPQAFGTLALACAGVLAVCGTAQALKESDATPNRAQFARTLAILHEERQKTGDDRPVLYEHPMMAVVDGQPAYMLDPYMFAVAGANDPAIAHDLWRKMEHHEFSAIVILRDPTDRVGREWFNMTYFGPGFIEELTRNYQRLPLHGGQFIYVPKPTAEADVR